MSAGPSPGQVEMAVRPATMIRFATVLLVSAYGFLLLIPVFLSFIVVSLKPIGTTTYVLPLLVLAASLFFLPFGFGNSRITRLVRQLQPDAGLASDTFVVQLAFHPRLQSGLRAVLEDADDFGCLALREDALQFSGDSVRLHLPYSRIRGLHTHNIGWRGLFLYGPKIQLQFSDGEQLHFLEFGDRSSLLLPASHRMARQLHARLEDKLGDRTARAVS